MADQNVQDGFVPAELPSFARYKKLFWRGSGASATRVLQYERLAQKKFKGTLLDFGGGDKAKYRDILNCESYESVNIDRAIAPTWITEVGEKLPCPRDHYDHVISLNTIEHIYDAQGVIRDIFDVLKKKGEFTCTIPFLYPVHGHPDDYFRPTASWWHQTLRQTGFSEIRIMPLLWGPFTTGLICSGLPGPLKWPRTQATLLLDLLYVKLRFRGKTGHFEGKAGEDIQKHALGYFIEAVK